ncbi:MAG TPA: hypothetical protein VJU83_08415 [Burkholderiales bacterium]|nr:hypothetical protein [Burkholderiales bacterium]
MIDSFAIHRRLIASIRWSAAPVHWRGFKVIGLGLAVFIVAALLLYTSAGMVDVPYFGGPMRIVGGVIGFIGWGIVLMGVIGELRSYKRRVNS